MENSALLGTPPSTSKGRGRKAGAGRGAGMGRGASAIKDVSPAKPSASVGTAPGYAAALAAAAPVSTAPGGGVTGTNAAAPAAAPAAAGLGPAGGVVKKRGRVPKAKSAGDLPATGADSGPEDAPDVSMPYRGTFTKDLSRLMYGFGDYENPIQETINVVEDILVEYVREMCCTALNEAARNGKLDRDRSSGTSKLKVDEKDILFLVRKDPKKYTRIRELLDMQLLIKEARKTLDVEKISEGDLDAGTSGAPGALGAAEEDPGEELPDIPDEDIEME
ncbi:hypothetical protein Vretimale_9019 [Volvox reticuliferus]|uniref:Transcription initiation factor TFIID subunit 13 n=1 Tax=Volvox reticuliferus TaxID=1737510 RepID=A0A8J4CVB5_9CHLO|nr:hypothetical protein Vretifemale_14477 [Volvox reticuliferus]GIM04442.1 hypothetical protein Vretimale_9019 [Volvox reticuliferus]